MYYHGALSVPETYRKYGPTTPSDATTVQWYTLSGVAFGSAEIDGINVPTATFTLTDGALGDDDTGADASGRIRDPGGPALPDSLFEDGFEGADDSFEDGFEGETRL